MSVRAGKGHLASNSWEFVYPLKHQLVGWVICIMLDTERRRYPLYEVIPVQATTSSPVQMWTLVVAALAVMATVASAILLRKTGKGQVEAARQAAAASERSAAAAERSSNAALGAVQVNRETAAGVAMRAEADALARRYQDAAEHLGHSKAPVRLAGVYAMARLADDWQSQRQTCVDVLCAYLRMPWAEDSYEARRSSDEYQVRQSIVKIFNSHLKPDAATPWHLCRIDLSGALLVDFGLWSCRLDGGLVLFGAELEGDCSLTDVDSYGSVSLGEVKVSGGFFVGNFRIRSGFLSLNRVSVGAGNKLHVDLSQVAPNATQAAVLLRPSVIAGDFKVTVRATSEEQGEVHIYPGQVENGGSAKILSLGDPDHGKWPLVCLIAPDGPAAQGWSVAEELGRKHIAHTHTSVKRSRAAWHLLHGD